MKLLSKGLLVAVVFAVAMAVTAHPASAKTAEKSWAWTPRVWAETGWYKGTVKVSWDHRGDNDCWIGYSEKESAGYNYKTVTSCDNGWINVGGLEPGKWYKFSVKNGRYDWSKPVMARAGWVMR